MDPSMPQDAAAPTDADSQAGTFTIEITVNGNGTFTVSTESGAQEAAEDQGGGDEDQGQTVNSLQEMLSLVKQMASSGGAPADDNSPVSDQKAAWNQESTKRAQAKQLFGG